MKPLDLSFLKALTSISNVIPVIAKSDSMTIEEKTSFKRRVKAEMEFHGIRCYPYDNPLDEEEIDRFDHQLNVQVRFGLCRVGFLAQFHLHVIQAQNMIPFAVVGSERNVVVDGKAVRGRRNRWGVVNGTTTSFLPAPY